MPPLVRGTNSYETLPSLDRTYIPSLWLLLLAEVEAVILRLTNLEYPSSWGLPDRSIRAQGSTNNLGDLAKCPVTER